MLLSTKIKISAALLLVSLTGAFAQLSPIQYFRPYDQRGINVFETSKTDTIGFDGLKLKLGANFTQQFQGLKHSNSENVVGEVNRNALYDLSPGFNLAMANFNIDAQLADGVRVSLVSYMSTKQDRKSVV